VTRLEQIGAKAAQQAFAHVPIIRPEQLAAMAEISGGSPHGAATIAAGDGSRLPSENEPAMARFQGRHGARARCAIMPR
jgi:multimeric flavodoxin WrbA